MSAVRLFPLPLLGAGTSQVESLPSYLHRAALQHGVFVGELIKFIYEAGVRDGVLCSMVGLPHYTSPAELVRPARTTMMLQNLLEKYGLQPLSESTLWILDKALGRSSGEVVDGFRWCPECMAEQRQIGKQGYFKLIWHLRSISVCPLHRTPLLSECGVCGCDQTGYKKKHPIDFCQDCGQSLSLRTISLTADMISPSCNDKGLDVVRLFDDLAGADIQRFPQDGVRVSLKDIFDYCWNCEKEEVFYQLLSRDKLLAIIHGQTPVSLKVARRLAYRLGVSLLDLFSGNAGKQSKLLFNDKHFQALPLYLESDQKAQHDHAMLWKKITTIVQNSEPPISLKALASQVGVSVGYIEYRYAPLAQDVVAKYRAYQEQQQLKKIHLAMKKALDFFIQEKYSEYPQSRKQAYRVLRQETRLPKHLLRKSIQTAFNVVY